MQMRLLRFSAFASAIVALACLCLPGCRRSSSTECAGAGGPRGDVVVFHAGSLAVPFQKIKTVFEARYPACRILAESSGSRMAARKISDLGRRCDLFLSADYTLIRDILMPEHASWYVGFAGNEMVLAYTEHSSGAERITQDNWFRVLLEPGVRFGRADENLDPCGYRTLMLWQLVEKHYGRPGLAENLNRRCPRADVRPKSVELIALLETGNLDYAFVYRSIAVQQGLKFVRFPDDVNLSSAARAADYARAGVDVTGKTPDEKTHIRGEPVLYALTVPNAARNKEAARALARFILGPEGRAILRASGQEPVVPPTAVGRGAAEILKEVKQ